MKAKVWAVVCINCEPIKTDSYWAIKEIAGFRATQLNRIPGTDVWEVLEWNGLDHWRTPQSPEVM